MWQEYFDDQKLVILKAIQAGKRSVVGVHAHLHQDTGLSRSHVGDLMKELRSSGHIKGKEAFINGGPGYEELFAVSLTELGVDRLKDLL